MKKPLPQDECVSQNTPPGVAIICNSLPPYRVHLHRRIVRELTGITLWTVCTHENTDGRWAFDPPEEIRPVRFGQGQTSSRQIRLRYALSEWRKGGRIIQWLKQQSIRAVVVLGYSDLGRLRVIHWCHRHAIPCLLWGDSNIHGDRAKGLKAVIKRLLLGKIISMCSGVLPCGTYGRMYFLKYGADPQHIHYFPLEPDYALINQITKEQIRHTKARFGLEQNRQKIIYSGRLIGLKRVDLLIDAFASIANDRPGWDVVIVGDGPLRHSLSARIPSHLRNRFFWTGFVNDQSELSSLYLLSDVLVLPSDQDAWALVVNEAVAAGLAIVSSSAVGASAELVRDGVNGRVFPSGDSDTLKICLLDVTKPDRLVSMKAASAHILSDWRQKADPVEGLRSALRFYGVLPD
jgi:glycosyltransferase involved in cell wall biosynthesis